MQESTDPESPEFWFIRTQEQFEKKLPENTRVANWENQPTTRRERLNLLYDYMSGNPPLPYVNDKYRSLFQKVMRKARINYAGLVISAMADTSKVASVTTEVDSDFDGDDFVRLIHDATGFESMQSDVQTWLFTFGEAYAQVVMPAEGLEVTDTPPIFTAEDPRTCVGIPDPLRPGILKSWVKIYVDDILDQDVAIFYWQGVKRTARREAGLHSTTFAAKEWDWSTEEGENDVTLVGLEATGGIPVVLFPNKLGMGEFEQHIDLLDRIMDQILNLIVIEWYQSFRQRAVSGDIDAGEDQSEDDDEKASNLIRSMYNGDDELKNLFEADPGALWIVPEGVQFWESAAYDYNGPLKAISDNVKSLSAVSHTPLVMFNPDGANQSATGSETMKEAHLNKVRDRQARMTPSLIQLHKIALILAGEEARAVNVRILWSPLTHYSLADLGQFMSQAKGTLSRHTLLSKYAEFTPEEVRANETQLLQEAMMMQQMTVTAPTEDPEGDQPTDDPAPTDTPPEGQEPATPATPAAPATADSAA